ncbi:Ervl/Alr family protein [Invertebrate iridescent virus 30]|uniref:Sulfhydryl oxidase n=1 Tax=Invertebrate iridescent virus 30 TaxID=345585 RepID=W8W2H4_9VIRU|nr:Ervl/Alr family protein [Invertebrate iridescent virus 30]CCV02210.1 Ervl/Alr family protein [Invertebrate iridescent virus 30]
MNLEPSIWGPHFWNTFHFISSTYDNKPNQSIKLTMKNFIQSIPVFLPCKECQDHAFDFLSSSNLDKIVENRKELFTFFFNFHNSVNLRLKKPLMKIEDALKKYYIPVEEYHLYLSSKKIIGPIFGSVENVGSAKSVGFPLLILMVIIIIVFTIFK